MSLFSVPSSKCELARGRRPFTENSLPCAKPVARVPGSTAPGNVTTRSAGLSVATGKSVICRALIVLVRAPSCVCKIRFVSAVTLTTSLGLPISSLTETSVVCPAATTTRSRARVLKPDAPTSTLYIPGSTASSRYEPSFRETVSRNEGSYRLDAVDPGIYKVEVGASGFKTLARDRVVVAAGQTTEVSVKLDIGSPSEVVNVTADTNLILQTQDGARTSTINARQITDLPVATLNPADLVVTLPGAVEPGTLATGFAQGSEFSVNGLRPRANSHLLDGTENNDISINGQAYIPSLRDGFQEVSVLGA